LTEMGDSIKHKRMMIVTGETSGDHHGAEVVKALRSIDPSVHVYGIGGSALAKAGTALICHNKHLSVVGIQEVVARMPQVLDAYRSIKEEIRKKPPDLILLIDYPDFNLRIAKIGKRHNIPVLYYISPQIWAWRKGRAQKIARIVDKMAVIFPFEVPFYEKVGLEAHFVGHPLLDQERDLMSREDALAAYQASGKSPLIGLLPGSRQGEVDRLLPNMLAAAAIIKKEMPTAGFLLPLAAGLDKKRVQEAVARQGVPIRIVEDGFYDVLNTVDFAIVVSGTATLETALMGKPMVIVYKVTPLTYLIGRLLIRVESIGLANIVAGKKVVPELIQGGASPERIAAESLRILENPRRMEEIRSELSRVKHKLGKKGAARRVAELACGMMHCPS